MKSKSAAPAPLLGRYTYRGPLSSVTLRGSKPVTLHPGHAVSLPKDSPYTKRLIAKGWLEDEPVGPKATPAAAEPGGASQTTEPDARPKRNKAEEK